MKIGVFDSGIGGLIITHSLINELPDYDYLYLGDTARLPYGSRSQATIYEFTRHAVEYLLDQDCALVIVACNTASAEALRRIQQEYLPKHYPDRRVLGVLIPAAEAAVSATKTGRIGVLATASCVGSKAFDRELHKLRPDVEVISQAAPLLVPLVENDGRKWAEPILTEYLQPLSSVDTLILGCTHYPAYKDLIRKQVGKEVTVLSQDEFIPAKVTGYLRRHPEIDSRLSRGGARHFKVTDITPGTSALAEKLTGTKVKFDLVELPQN